MRLYFGFGGVTFIFDSLSFTITPFRWVWRKKTLVVGNGRHLYSWFLCLSTVQPNKWKQP